MTWANAVDLLVSIDGENFSPIKAGMSVKLAAVAKPFYTIQFQNITGGIVLLEYAISTGEIVDSRFNAVGVVVAAIPGLAVANGYGVIQISNVAPGTVVMALNIARRSFIIRNLAGNAGNMFIGFTNLLTNINYAIRLTPGEVYTNSDYTGVVYVLSTVNLEAVSFGEI